MTIKGYQIDADRHLVPIGPEQAAERSRAEFERALGYLRSATEGWRTRAYLASAMTGSGVSTPSSAARSFGVGLPMKNKLSMRHLSRIGWNSISG